MGKSLKRGDRLIPALVAGVLTFLLFLLLPLSRMLSPDSDEERWNVREITPAQVPPPPPPEPVESQQSSLASAAAPDLRPAPEQLSLKALPITLSVNPDADLIASPAISSLAGGFNAGDEIRRFTFADLDGGPRVLSVPPVSIPLRLARRGFGRGRVVFSIRILTDGSVEILDVLESTHPELIDAARRSASRARFEPPEINGQPVEVEGKWPLLIDASPR
ncbi:energy transducer TonB [Puniceicoccus vermicola]|uniref:Energy transducer TonB n=1 Tax=Puniceicoccus vermicola TaxID=388746 RepID=A0A7X1B107_9BACT|nr:energy transducer TonB [Puniceicoccus vermicola]MBC2603638.1 energy transducer TonB [Puniceicoccus vermicola]